MSRLNEDMADRDQQASALAAAGMVAEKVGLAQEHQGLQAPPALGGSVPASTTATTSELDSINWNLMDIGAGHLDDMDLDFAALFDTEMEEANMRTAGSGWPTTSSASEQVALSPAPVHGEPRTEGV